MNCRAGEAGMCWLLNARHWHRKRRRRSREAEEGVRLQGFQAKGSAECAGCKVHVHTRSSAASQQPH